MNISKTVKILLRNPKLVMARRSELKKDHFYFKLDRDKQGKIAIKMIADYLGNLIHIESASSFTVQDIIATDWIILDLDKRDVEPSQSTKCSECHAYCELNNHQGFCSIHNFIMDQDNEDDERCYKLKPVIKDKFWEDE